MSEPELSSGAGASPAERDSVRCDAWMAEVEAALAHAEKREIECRLEGEVVWPMIWRMLGRWAKRIIAKQRPSAIEKLEGESQND